MAHLITGLDVREINNVLVRIQADQKRASSSTDTPSAPRFASSVPSSSGSHVSGQDATRFMVATNHDGSIQVDSDGYAVVEEVQFLEPL